MKIEDLRDHMDNRFDRFDEKLDDHLERLSRAEVAIEFIKGHLKVSTAFALSVLGGVVVAYIRLKG